MNKRNVSSLKVGDYIEVRHNLGKGHVTKIAMNEQDEGAPGRGRYPMIQYRDVVGDVDELPWVTYLLIQIPKTGYNML